MRRIITAIVLTLLIITGTALGSDDGFTRSGSFWFRDGSSTPYVRKDNWTWIAPVWVPAANCYSCGYWSAGYWKFAGYTYTAVSIDPNRSDARQLLLAMARDAKAADNTRLARAQEHKETLELAQALGLQGVLTPSFTGYPALSGTLQLSSAGSQGNTVYGYQSYQQTTQTYGGLSAADQLALLQQTIRLTEQAQTNAAAAHANTVDLTRVTTQEQVRLAERQIAGNTALGLMQQTKPDPSSKTTTTITTVAPAVSSPVAAPAVAEFVKMSGPAKCVACHSGTTKQAGFDVAIVPTMTDRSKLLERLLTDDPAKRMPKDQPALSAAEILQFFPNHSAPAAPAKMPAAKE